MNCFDIAGFVSDCEAVRSQSPLVHCITNYVSAGFLCNGLLALGATPFFSFLPEEMEETTRCSDALCINIGTLNSQQIEAMKIASRSARHLGRPWVLDPVGFGATKLRCDTVLSLINDGHPSVIRGNMSEIYLIALSYECDPVPWKGAEDEDPFVDSEAEFTPGVESTLNLKSAVGMAVALARKTGSTVCITGMTSYFTDGDRLCRISNGSPAIKYVTGVGCMWSAVIAAFLAVDKDPFNATMNASALMGVAGEASTTPEALRNLGKQIKGVDAPEWMVGPVEKVFMFTVATYIPGEFAKMVRGKDLELK